MCGIAGYFTLPRSRTSDQMTAEITRMTDAIILRGPDDAGAWVDAETGIALGHRRLSILDLSPLGHQPMASADGRFVLVFNGEIYNFQELRAELEPHGHSWRGHSDTEVMLAAFLQWGVAEATRQFNGMFAFAVWDKQERALHLGRDRLGEKPLYYGWLGNTFVFASELKAVRQFPGFDAGINRDALCSQLRFNYIPDPHCIYQGFHKLPPASLITLSAPGDKPVPQLYWSLREVIEYGVDHPFTGTETEAIDTFESILRKAVGMRMISDVPLGAFLSGGVDSSLIVAMMQAQSTRPVRTFTIGFDVPEYNEAEFAKAVANHLRTDHTEMYVTGKDALATIPLLPALYDEPFSDYSQIPTYLVCKMARQHVTVALSGDAGDELFGGYERYFVGRSLWDKFAWMPPALKKTVAGAMTFLPPHTLNSLGSMAGPVLPKRLRHVPFGDKLHKLAEVVAAPGMETLYLNLMSHWKQPENIVIGGHDPQTSITNKKGWPRVTDFTHRMMHLDMENYLPGDILTKVDRAAMGVSLEGRIPLLDTDLIEFAWRVPYSMKVRQGKGKWLMRETLYRHVPKAMIDRPKRGFGVPLGQWLRAEMRDWAEDLLSETRLKREGFFHPAPIRQKWQEHLSGTRNWQFYLWDILMFQAWLAEQK
ncbi:asparagine synthase (glutamine-hydrolyzing) [Prosthecobacter dejongeii]|uniref:asparagine synthase (glutamine-hydrolyzing) n=1 Tax=Prosthecobacter dejongeii TaxID=48465 RepID=A0A7W7YPT6_9BACT|nr:asparagine synthase (glutamine-hydrolyzing) [Prosthecobacter dejongeii]MBB5039957.1 asparagine synthase (glutamine-hydrolyzing) [Prosthecobacter dejongeii]